MKTVQDKNLLEMPIGVFDSGYGGLTILKEIVRKLPEYNYVYLGDNARALTVPVLLRWSTNIRGRLFINFSKWSAAW